MCRPGFPSAAERSSSPPVVAYQAEAVKFLQEVDAPCLEKPFTREELFRTIEGLVASKG